MTDPEEQAKFKFRIPMLPDGRAVTMEELEREVLARLENDSSSRKQSLWDLAVIYSTTERRDKALETLNKLAVLTSGPEERAQCYLGMGQLREQAHDYEGAVGCYKAAFGMEPQETNAWYWINNNLGYSLVQLGRCQEAESYLRRAIGIDPARSNAFKNLGLAFLGQERRSEAADHFVLATHADCSDGRSLAHLEQLVTEHPELMTEVPNLGEKLDACRGAVRQISAMQPDLDKHWNKLRRRQSRPWWAFWR